MGELVVNSNDDSSVVKLSNSGQSLSIKAYQDVYHQITGRTEEIRKKVSKNLLISFDDIDQLNHKIMQLCDVHRVIAANQDITIFYEQERKENFSSFERFRKFNSNNTCATTAVILKYYFSIIPAGLDKPQEYEIAVKLVSRIAQIKTFAEEAPPFMVDSGVMNHLADKPAEIRVSYVDYVIARGFIEAFTEWSEGCKKSPKNRGMRFLQKHSSKIPEITKMITSLLIVWSALHYISSATNFESNQILRFAVIYIAGFHCFNHLSYLSGRKIESIIDKSFEISYLNLTKGDSHLIEIYEKKSGTSLMSFIVSTIWALSIGVIAAKLEKLI